MDLLNFLTDDWKKIPANYRWLIIAGAFLIFNTWLLDHWGSSQIYLFWGFDIRSLGYSVGLTLILLAFMILIVKQFWYFKTVLDYRKKYPLNRLNEDFFLISFKGYVVLFDLKTHKHHHILPWETAQDLQFVDEWSYLDISFPPSIDFRLPIGNTGKTIPYSKFQTGTAINTRI